MKKLLYLLIIFTLFSAPIEAKVYRAEQVLKYVHNTPRESENYLNRLVQYLTKPFDNDYNKAQAIAFWIASRINYDQYLYNNGSTTRLIKNYKGQSAKELIKSRVGICGDFANLFDEMCNKAGIRSEYITGYVYRYGSRANKKTDGHAWNSFKYKNKTILVDTTFMAKGVTGVSGSGSSVSQNRAYREIKNDNKKESQINNIDSFWFDFNEKDEKSKKKYIRKEK